MDSVSILLVEDNPNDRELAMWAFRECRVPVALTLAKDGEEALDILFTPGQFANPHATGDPALVLLDLKLPGLPGLGVLKAIRENPRTRWLPVVVLTTSTEESDIAASYSLGANGYVQKPIDFMEFKEVVAQLSRYWLESNIPPPRGPEGPGH